MTKRANDARKKTADAARAGSASRRARRRQAVRSSASRSTLYEGGQYWLYKYRRYTDVRLVFAPEDGIAAFGGDPDNFQFPRWCLDMSVLRAYDSNGKPAAHAASPADRCGVARQPGELVFVSGHPGLDRPAADGRAAGGAARRRPAASTCCAPPSCAAATSSTARPAPKPSGSWQNPLQDLENSIKVRRKQLDALLDDRLLARKRQEEAALRAKVAADPQLAAGTGDPWARDRARRASLIGRSRSPTRIWKQAAGFNSSLFGYARTLVRGRGRASRSRTTSDCANIATRPCRASSSNCRRRSRSIRSWRS